MKKFGESIKNYNAEFESEAKQAIKDSNINKELEKIKVPFDDFSQKLGEIKEQMSEKDYNAVMEELKKILGNVSFAEFNSTFNSIFFDIDNYLNELEKNIDAEIKDSKFLENLSNLRKIDANLIEELKKISATSPTFKEQIEELVNQLKDIDSQKYYKTLMIFKPK